MELILASITTLLLSLQFAAGQQHNARYTFAVDTDRSIIVMDTQTGEMTRCNSVEHCDLRRRDARKTAE